MTLIDKWLSDAFESLDSIEGLLSTVSCLLHLSFLTTVVCWFRFLFYISQLTPATGLTD